MRRTNGRTSNSTASSICSGSSSTARPGGPAAVQNEHVDAAERGNGSLDKSLEVRRNRQVTAHPECADPIRLDVENLAAPREHRDVRPLQRERLRDRQSHPR